MKYFTPSEAVQLIESGESIYIQGSTSIPEVLCQALADRGEELRDASCNVGDPVSVPGLGRSPGEGNGYPLQHS